MTNAASRMKMLALAVGALGCQDGSLPLETPEGAGSEPARFELGTVTGAGGRVALPRTVFNPRDTVWLSFSRPAAADSVVVRWIRVDGDDPGAAIDSAMGAPDSAGVLSFFASPASGWPLGRYVAEVTVRGRRAGSATFEVR